jgi:hypothetical protein
MLKRACAAIAALFATLSGAGAQSQSQSSVQALINTQVPISWQNGLSGAAMSNILTALNTAIFQGNPLPGYSIGALPGCSLGSAGLLVYVTNGLAPTGSNMAVGASGSATLPVFCGGVVWSYLFAGSSLAAYTIAALPSCVGSSEGQTAYVTNGYSLATYNATLNSTLTGALALPVFCDGSAWRYH